MRWVISFVMTAVLAAASISSTIAAKHAKPTKAKLSGACAQQNGRCVSDCDQSNWCTMYTCVNGQSNAGTVLALLPAERASALHRTAKEGLVLNARSGRSS